MSQENVESLRAFLEPWGREPWTLEAGERGGVIDMSLLDPEVVYEDENLPDHIGEAYRGHEGIIRAAKRWVEPNEWLLVELEQIVGHGDPLVAIHRARSKARQRDRVRRAPGLRLDLPRREDHPLPIVS